MWVHDNKPTFMRLAWEIWLYERSSSNTFLCLFEVRVKFYEWGTENFKELNNKMTF